MKLFVWIAALAAISATALCESRSSLFDPEASRIRIMPQSTDARMEDIQESPDGSRLITSDRLQMVDGQWFALWPHNADAAALVPLALGDDEGWQLQAISGGAPVSLPLALEWLGALAREAAEQYAALAVAED